VNVCVCVYVRVECVCLHDLSVVKEREKEHEYACMMFLKHLNNSRIRVCATATQETCQS